MLKLVFFLIFLIPMLFNMWMLCNSIILSLLMYIMFFNKDLYTLGFSLCLNNMSFGLIILTLWISFLMIMSSPYYKSNYMKYFLFMVLLLMILLIMSFLSMNLMTFYILFESSLIPTLIIIMGWGYQPERMMASYYLLFYTLFASLPMLLSILYLYKVNMTNIMIMMSSMENIFLYIGMIMAFLVKMPLFMFHFWLPKAHVEAPISGSMILAGILLKLGGYGLIRILYIMPMMFYNYSYIWISISILGALMVSMVCMIQVDMKSMIAYSSVAHMGMVISGIMTMNTWGMLGSYYMMIGHGLCSSGLFCLSNISYERMSSRSILINSGMLTFMPSMTLMWFLMCSSNMSCPPTVNLAGEILIINSMMMWNSMSMLFISCSSFLSACYSLYMFSYTQHGQFFSGSFSFSSGYTREFLLIMMHWVPLNILMLKLNMLM
uniref:NADH-ubiquinone oxidoreductase chain 4 n=1 Tax=Platypedia putnami TaxID=324535 RepID=A0A3S7MGM4_9HEMI|nr:NADH dehydrogenase subunit 4 [Platypedia putnami]